MFYDVKSAHIFWQS